MNPQASTTDGAVVVAIDDSPSSRAALAWAAEYARAVQTPLTAVHVMHCELGSPAGWSPGFGGIPPTPTAAEIDLYRSNLQLQFDTLAPEATWSLGFLEGPTGPTIVEHTQQARLLVVGTREHRGMDRLLLGSVSHYLLSHAACPVVAVPPDFLALAAVPLGHTPIPMASGVLP